MQQSPRRLHPGAHSLAQKPLPVASGRCGPGGLARNRRLRESGRMDRQTLPRRGRLCARRKLGIYTYEHRKI